MRDTTRNAHRTAPQNPFGNLAGLLALRPPWIRPHLRRTWPHLHRDSPGVLALRLPSIRLQAAAFRAVFCQSTRNRQSRVWARPGHICTGTRARPSHVCTGTGLSRATFAPGMGSFCHICTGTGLAGPTSAVNRTEHGARGVRTGCGHEQLCSIPQRRVRRSRAVPDATRAVRTVAVREGGAQAVAPTCHAACARRRSVGYSGSAREGERACAHSYVCVRVRVRVCVWGWVGVSERACKHACAFASGMCVWCVFWKRNGGWDHLTTLSFVNLQGIGLNAPHVCVCDMGMVPDVRRCTHLWRHAATRPRRLGWGALLAARSPQDLRAVGRRELVARPVDLRKPFVPALEGLGRAAATSASGLRLAAATSARGLGSPLPHLHRDWGSPLPHLQDVLRFRPRLPSTHCTSCDRCALHARWRGRKVVKGIT